MNTSKRKIFKVGDVVAFNFTEVKTPMKIIKILNKHASLVHRDLKYSCGMIDMRYLETFKNEFEKEYSNYEVGIDLTNEKDKTSIYKGES